MNWLKRYRDDAALVILIIGLAAAVFVFFKVFFDAGIDDLTTEILAALLGSILTVMITMLLLKRQGSIEQAHEAAAASKTKIFEKKLELFRDFTRMYVKAASDGTLTPAELMSLEELALTISLFTSKSGDEGFEKDLGEEICRFVLQLEMLGIRESMSPEELTRDLRAAYANGQVVPHATEEVAPVAFREILRLMKVELGVVDSTREHAHARDTDGCRWAHTLLGYRDYQAKTPA